MPHSPRDLEYEKDEPKVFQDLDQEEWTDAGWEPWLWWGMVVGLGLVIIYQAIN